MPTSDTLPLLLEPAELEPLLGRPDLLILDLSSADNYARGHVPGAIHLPAAALQCGIKPAAGKLPSAESLSLVFSRLGLAPDKLVIAYDDEGGGWAGRLIWTLDVLGHTRYAYLDGGRHSWANEGHPLETTANAGKRSDFVASIDPAPIATLDEILAGLGDPQRAIWDARSAGEYRGEKVAAARGGHIPGAVNLDWLELMDPQRNLRLRDRDSLRRRLAELGLTPDKQIATHCHSHHRSGLTYLAMKILGYPRIKGYDGSWAEWGNRADTPIEL
jgi:thiosulfate/3-mercaptopyruvate sulfurtransferase